MTRDIMEKIFTLFFKTKDQGIGFGLPTCERIVEALGEVITVADGVGEKITFIINLPISSSPILIAYD